MWRAEQVRGVHGYLRLVPVRSSDGPQAARRVSRVRSGASEFPCPETLALALAAEPALKALNPSPLFGRLRVAASRTACTFRQQLACRGIGISLLDGGIEEPRR